MTITAYEAGTPVPVRIGPPDPRTALINAARNRYRLSTGEINTALDRYAPGLKVEHRWHWLDALADLADRRDLLDVANTCEARAALEQLREGPWDCPLTEALTRRDEIDAEIDDMARKVQA